MHLVMPMAGRGSRFYELGFTTPKPMIEINGKPFFYWAVNSVKEYSSLTFVVLKEHIEDFKIDNCILKYYPNANIVILDDVTDGAVITSLKGCKWITDNKPIVFNDCDHKFSYAAFNNDCDGQLMTFKSSNAKFSYIEKNNDGNVKRTIEKQVISNDAICGCYWFKDVTIFRKYANIYINNCEYSEFYMSGVYNTMIKDSKIVKNIEAYNVLSFGTPQEYAEAERNWV